jgi:hypothetical protein
MSAADVARFDALQSGVTSTPREESTVGYSAEDSATSHSLGREKKTPARPRSRVREGEEQEGSDEDIMSIDEDDLPDACAGVSEQRASMQTDSADGIDEEGDNDENGDVDAGVSATASRDEDSERVEAIEDCSVDDTAAADEEEGEGEAGEEEEDEEEGEEEGEGEEEDEEGEDDDEGSGVRADSRTGPSNVPTTPAAAPTPLKVISTVGERNGKSGYCAIYHCWIVIGLSPASLISLYSSSLQVNSMQLLLAS